MAGNIVSNFSITNVDGLLVVDSRLIAERLGIQHESFIKTIRKHRERLEQRFGHLRFEIRTVTNSVGAVNEITFALLTEDQAQVLMTLSRNTEQVIDCKMNLVEAFSKAKQIIATVIPAQNDRIRELELELALAQALTQKALVEQKILDTRHTIVTTCPEIVQQKILGYTLVEKIEYRDRIIHNDDIIRDGATITKTEMCRRLDLTTRSGAPDYKALKRYLESSRLPSEAWKLTASIQEYEELKLEYWEQLEDRFFDSERNYNVGE